MRQALEHEHTLLEDEAPRNDLVLGAPALLGIFFALALICAVCFGFGYSSARTVHMPLQAGAGTASLPTVPTPESRSAAAAASSIPDDDTQDGTDNASNASMGSGGNAPRTTPGSSTLGATPPSTAAKPTPGTASTQQEYWPPSDTAQAGAAPRSTSPQQALSRAARPGAGSLSEAPSMGSADAKPFGVAASIPARRPPAAPAVEAEPTPVAQGPVVNLMVQIAAVSHAADAQTLSSALRHDGFAAMVRTATGDPFFHVQVGPFHSVSEAKAMRARLADSGYNAFIKP